MSARFHHHADAWKVCSGHMKLIQSWPVEATTTGFSSSSLATVSLTDSCLSMGLPSKLWPGAHTIILSLSLEQVGHGCQQLQHLHHHSRWPVGQSCVWCFVHEAAGRVMCVVGLQAPETRASGEPQPAGLLVFSTSAVFLPQPF